MARSKLIAGRSKKSTTLVTVDTLREAIKHAHIVIEANPNDPSLNPLRAAVDHIVEVLNVGPQQMRRDGVSGVSDYTDTDIMPEVARQLKEEVDMCAKYYYNAERSKHQPAPKQSNGGGSFVTDRDEKGEAKQPERAEVPRLAGRKKKEAEDPMAAPPVAAPPAPAASGGNPIDYIPTETLIKVIGDLPKEDDFAQNKGKQDAVVQLTEILKTRPVLPPEQEGAPTAPAASTAPALAEPAAIPPPVTAAKKKADLGDHAVGNGGTISNGSGASAQVGQGGSTSTPQQVSTKPEPQKNKIDLGGLSIASSIEDKTAEDYRLHDYKITNEGIRPSSGLPNMDEQEQGHHSTNFPEVKEEELVTASLNKEAVTPPGISEELMHKLKKEYPGDKSKAYATAWSIHNKKESALKVIAAEIEKIATGFGGGWFTSYKPMEVDEDGGRTPEIAEAHAGLEDNTGISHPETTEPIKLNEQQGLKTGAKVAAELTTSKAVKQSETLGNDLKKLYLEAKSLTQVNDTRPVREAVEAIFRAADLFDNATKTLNKQDQQEKSEAEAAEIKAKNKKSSGGLALAAAE